MASNCAANGPDLGMALERLKDRAADPHTCTLHNETLVILQQVASSLDKTSRLLEQHCDSGPPNGHIARWEFDRLERTVVTGLKELKDTQDAQGATLSRIETAVDAGAKEEKRAESRVRRFDAYADRYLKYLTPLALAALGWWMKH